jgi:outer membrane protein OmpA-like peptidoglycan-associated protein
VNKLICLLLLALTAPCALAAGDPAVPEEVRDTLFNDANEALKAANEAQGNLLAPESYGEGAGSYRRAEATLAAGGSLDAIQRDLARATGRFRAAVEKAEAARALFTAALTAREEAQAADASDFAADAWKDAERKLADAALELERGREKRAARSGEEAEGLFKAAELQAIKTNYLATTRELLGKADDLRAERYAPLSFERAQSLLNEAEQELNANRYDTDRPRNLAQLAEHNARHAIYVATLENRIRRDKTTLEEILLDWEASIAELADQLDVPVYFDEGQEQAIADLKTRIQTLQADIEFLEQGVADRDAQIASLILEVGGQSASLERMNRMLAKQQRQRERFASVEALFEPEQATVLRQGDNVILRMIGLNFETGRSAIEASHEPLLARVREAISLFPEASLVIEGHTDSFGSDSQNLALSQARADAVMQYLLANTPLSPANVRALGYGESRPVANNETPEGRKRNRRIDIVIYPVW